MYNMPYLNFITDEHLMNCIGEVYQKYQLANYNAINNLNRNKVDVIKMAFDMEFYNVNNEQWISMETGRQADKSVSNSIGYFHQHIISGINDLIDLGQGGGCDITNITNTLFVEIKNKYNTMNSSSAESTYQKLQKYAEEYPNSICYLLEIIASQSQDIHWQGTFNGNYYNHPNVRRISADKFYELVTGQANAFYDLCNILPIAISDYLHTQGFNTLSTDASIASLRAMMGVTFNGYNGFNFNKVDIK